MTTQLLQLRCSALPRAFLCAGSVRTGDVVINATNEAAQLGTAAHAGLAVLVETGAVDWDAVPELARTHGVPEVDLRVLLANGAKLWALCKDSFPAAQTEVEMSHAGDGFVLTGHADILGRSGRVAYVGDWKGGRLDSDYREQLLGYCALALLGDATLETATAGVLWIREGDYEHYSMTRAQLGDWLVRLAREVIEWDGTYRPGGHCGHCPRNHECPAALALARRDVAAIANLNFDEASFALMTPSERIALVVTARAVAKIAERVCSAAKADVVRNGDIEADGKRLTLQQSESRFVKVLEAFPVLEAAGFDDADMAQVIDISVAKAEGIVAKRAAKRKGAAAVRELQAQLAAADAIVTSTITSLVVRRV